MSIDFFFFNQKTAYDMRISDWSSDVCSSDLLDELALRQHPTHHVAFRAERADEGGENDGPGVRHQLGDLAHPADVLHAVGISEAKVLVKPVADIVAVQQEDIPATGVQLLLTHIVDGRFTRPGKDVYTHKT